MPQLHEFRYPRESDEYRTARNALLEAEQEHHRKTEELAKWRRALPPGGEVPEDYTFVDRSGGSVSILALFGPTHDTLVLYSFMYRAEGTPCPMCTVFLDGLNGNVPHLSSHVAIGAVAQATPAELDAFAAARNWDALQLLSCGGTGYGLAYGGEDNDANQFPMLNVFRKSEDGVRDFYGTELFFAPPEEGQHPRHMDPMWTLWNILDATLSGRPQEWWPQLNC